MTETTMTTEGVEVGSDVPSRPTETRTESIPRKFRDMIVGILTKVLVGVIVAIIGAGIGYMLFRPSPVAFARCEPSVGQLPLEIQCFNESRYAKDVKWQFGDDTASHFLNEDVVRYTYAEPGEFAVVLSAHGRGKDAWKQVITVLSRTELLRPLRIDVVASTSRARWERKRIETISETKADHPLTFGTHSRTYRVRFPAAPGYRIVETEFREHSANNSRDFRCTVARDGSEVECSYVIESGPAVDRWRGWLRGDLVIREAKSDPLGTAVLARNLDVSDDGVYVLDEAIPLEIIESVCITSSNGRTLTQGRPSRVLLAPDDSLAFRIFERGGRSYLEVQTVQ